MPNIITHDLFCQEVFKNLPQTYTILNNRQAYRIGSNGPDFLFFHKLFKKGESKIAKIGVQLHDDYIHEFYETAILTCAKEETFLKSCMISYLIGHYLHWQLDSVMHPYVFYHTGFSKKEYKYNHYRFESMMDTMLLRHFNQQSTKQFKTYQVCAHNDLIIDSITKIYIPSVQASLQQKITREDIKRALHDWQQVQKLLYDPYMVKYKLAKIVEKTIAKPWLVTGNVVTTKIDTKHDILNLNGQTWYHPVTKEASQEGVLELFEKAKQRALKGIPILMHCIKINDASAFLRILNHATYTTGLEAHRKMLYEDIIYK